MFNVGTWCGHKDILRLRKLPSLPFKLSQDLGQLRNRNQSLDKLQYIKTFNRIGFTGNSQTLEGSVR